MGLLLTFLALALTALQVLEDRRLYPRFKAMTETGERQAMFRRWVIESSLRYGALGAAGVFLLGRGEAFFALPAEIAAARDGAAGALGMAAGELEQAALTITIALCVGMMIGAIVPFFAKGKVAMVGDIEPLLPRNRAEMRWTAALSVNAGVSEEIFFRLMAPLAIFAASGDFALAYLGAAALFGLAHAYQGWAGVIASSVIGLIFTALYLATGQIWVPIALHALLDLRGLVLLPLAMGRGR